MAKEVRADCPKSTSASGPVREDLIIKLTSRYIAGMSETIAYFRTELPIWSFCVLVEDADGNSARLVELIEKEGYSTLIPPWFKSMDYTGPWPPEDLEQREKEYFRPWASQQEERGKKVFGSNLGNLIDTAEALQRYVDDPEGLIRLNNIFYSYIEHGLAVIGTFPGGQNPVPVDKDGVPTHPNWHGSVRAFRDMIKQAIDEWPHVRAGLEAWLVRRKRLQVQASEQPTEGPTPKKKRGRKRLRGDRVDLYRMIYRLWNGGKGGFRTHQELVDHLHGHRPPVTKKTIKNAMDWARLHPVEIKKRRKTAN